ncbi:MAG: hypothetical protein KME32_33890 [Mojavia pulchra JT2-VF2]|jgi:hypothetical protein|uniref:J domain-containing protein n=1 Tax=Mojavia pulchra JT2-VF2 TaxID=287848 RepID=A0A951UK56_9NOST|nr:hypothetical protein [Mojavia pulchra JT2-VF2]
MSLKQLKEDFTAKTGMPAKKAYVLLAAPSVAKHNLRSIADWKLVLSSIEFKLVKVGDEIFKNIPSDETDDDWIKQLDDIDNEFRSQRENLKQDDPETYEFEELTNSETDEFEDDFSRCQNTKEIKALYRKLSKSHHPDNGGNTEVFKSLNRSYNLALERMSSKA